MIHAQNREGGNQLRTKGTLTPLWLLCQCAKNPFHSSVTPIRGHRFSRNADYVERPRYGPNAQVFPLYVPIYAELSLLCGNYSFYSRNQLRLLVATGARELTANKGCTAMGGEQTSGQGASNKGRERLILGVMAAVLAVTVVAAILSPGENELATESGSADTSAEGSQVDVELPESTTTTTTIAPAMATTAPTTSSTTAAPDTFTTTTAALTTTTTAAETTTAAPTTTTIAAPETSTTTIAGPTATTTAAETTTVAPSTTSPETTTSTTTTTTEPDLPAPVTDPATTQTSILRGTATEAEFALSGTGNDFSTFPLGAATFDGQRFVTLTETESGYSLGTSIDGLEWESTPVGGLPIDPNTEIYPLLSHDGTLIALGTSYSDPDRPAWIATSTDGLSWTSVNLPETGVDGFPSLPVVFEDRVFVLDGIGSGTEPDIIISGPIGGPYAASASNLPNPSSIRALNQIGDALFGTFNRPIPGDDGSRENLLLTSTDGLTWEPVGEALPTANGIRTVGVASLVGDALYYTTPRDQFLTSPSVTYISTDGAETWTEFSLETARIESNAFAHHITTQFISGPAGHIALTAAPLKPIHRDADPDGPRGGQELFFSENGIDWRRLDVSDLPVATSLGPHLLALGDDEVLLWYQQDRGDAATVLRIELN